MGRPDGAASGGPDGPRRITPTSAYRARTALGARSSCARRTPRRASKLMTESIWVSSGPEVRAASVPHLTLLDVFGRFLRFGLVAWGGPVAQIAMLRHALVEDERWVTSEHFNRVLALYQVLPGPEAHEMCVYFGMLARGRLGGIAAGLRFMLPGFVLMFVLSWAYLALGLDLHGKLAALF